MYERFERLLKERGLRASDVSKATGIASGVLTDWKKGRYTPKIDKMQKIADFFGVSVNYLQGIDNTEKDFNETFFNKTAFESYLNQIGWKVSRTKCEEGMPCNKCGKELVLSDAEKELYPFGKTEKICEQCQKEKNHYIISNGTVSANVPDDDFNEFEKKIREECFSVIREMILKSMDHDMFTEQKQESQLLAAHERKGVNELNIDEIRQKDIDML